MINLHFFKEYIEKLNNKNIVVKTNIDKSLFNIKIDCISYDSRNLFGNSLFICKGHNFKIEFAKQAEKKGAICCISDKPLTNIKNNIVVNDIRTAITTIAKLYYNNPQKNIITIGLTGTKGKGSTAFILRYILDKYLTATKKPKCAILSGIQTYTGKQTFVPSLTTPETFELYKDFDEAKKNDISHLIMEVSSQALKYRRVDGIDYDICCFTNFGRDHISDIEHPNIDDYLQSKLKIFNNSKIACVNSSSKKFDLIYNAAKANCKTITYGKNKNDDIYCSNIKLHGDSSSFDITTKSYKFRATLNIGGVHNIENAICAIAIAYCLNIPKEYIIEGIKSASIPGRMKVLKNKDLSKIAVIDYAHNQMSFNALFSSIKNEYPTHKIIAIFGAPGNKAYNRRLEMPAVASKYADKIIITEDDSATESFTKISNDIVSSITNTDFKVIENRKEAIEYTLNSYTFNKTIFVIAGKGEENFIKRSSGKEPYAGDLNIVKSIFDKKFCKINS